MPALVAGNFGGMECDATSPVNTLNLTTARNRPHSPASGVAGREESAIASRIVSIGIECRVDRQRASLVFDGPGETRKIRLRLATSQQGTTLARKRGKPRKTTGSRSQPVAPSEAPPPPTAPQPKAFSLRAMLTMVALAAIAVLAVGALLQFRGDGFVKHSPSCMALMPTRRSSVARPAPAATRHEAKLWQGSQHQLAMAHATDKSVLGDFSARRSIISA